MFNPETEETKELKRRFKSNRRVVEALEQENSRIFDEIEHREVEHTFEERQRTYDNKVTKQANKEK